MIVRRKFIEQLSESSTTFSHINPIRINFHQRTQHKVALRQSWVRKSQISIVNVVTPILQQINVDRTIEMFSSIAFVFTSKLSFDAFSNLENASWSEFSVEDSHSVEKRIVREHIHRCSLNERRASNERPHLL